MHAKNAIITYLQQSKSKATAKKNRRVANALGICLWFGSTYLLTRTTPLLN